MTAVNGEYGRTRSAPQSTRELLSLMGRSIASSWKRYLGVMIGFAILAFFVNLLLLQYNAVIRGTLDQYLNQIYQIFDPVIQFLRLDLALKYENLIPMAFLWLLIGVILVIFNEKGIKGLAEIPTGLAGSIKDIKKAGIVAIVIFCILAFAAFYSGLYLNNIILVFACVITLLYALSARQNGVLIMALRLIWSDIGNMGGGKTKERHLVSLGYPVSVLFGIWLGLLGSFLYILLGYF